MTVLLDFDEYVLVLILLNLGVGDLLSARKTCGAVCHASRSKFLWLHVLRTLVEDEDIVLPSSTQDPHQLTARQLETLVLMTRKNRELWVGGTLDIKNVTRLDLPQTVDWLKLVHGRWLFVASSDNFVSKLSFWDLSLTSQGIVDPSAECYLPARVNSCLVDEQDTGKVVLAASLDSSSAATAVHIFCMQRHPTGSVFFSELCCIPGLSYLHLLHNDYMVCGMRNGLSLAYLVNWKTTAEFALAPDPGPEYSIVSVSLLGKYLIAVFSDCVRIFTMPAQDQPPQFLDLLFYPNNYRVTEAVSITKDTQLPVYGADTSTTSPATFILLTNDELLKIDIDLQQQPSGSQKKPSFSLSLQSTVAFSDSDIWYHLRPHSLGRRLMWLIDTADQSYQEELQSPRIKSSVPLPSSTTGNARPWSVQQELELVWDSSLPVLWAYPQFDYDDTIGVVVAGNIFGELAIVDYLGSEHVDIWSFSRDIVESDPRGNPAPLAPLSLNLPEWTPTDHRFQHRPPPPFNAAAVSWAAQPSIWDLDPTIPRDHEFSADWPKWKEWYCWQGLPGDTAWYLERYQGFRGRPRPLAYGTESGSVIFEAGGTYFILSVYEGDETLAAYPPNASLSDIFSRPLRHSSRPTPFPNGAWGPKLEYLRYECHTLREDECEQRNRWVEQKERGGRPPALLLEMMEPPPPEPSVELDRSRITVRDFPKVPGLENLVCASQLAGRT